MASLVLKMSISLDGYVASADGSNDWIAAGRSDDSEWVLGATTYAEWAAFWPGASTLGRNASWESRYR
jgi:hypothetical protein